MGDLATMLRDLVRHLPDRWISIGTEGFSFHQTAKEAANRIEALEAENARLRDALVPFVEGYTHTNVFLRTREKMHPAGQDLYHEDVERARQAMKGHDDEQ